MKHGLVCLAILSMAACGCSLNEVVSKSRVGPEFRHSGSNRHENVRWTVQEGIDLKWSNGVTTGVTYRRRDVDAGSGDHDDGVWFDFSFPIWKAKKKDDSKERIAELESRLAELEQRLQETTNAG